LLPSTNSVLKVNFFKVFDITFIRNIATYCRFNINFLYNFFFSANGHIPVSISQQWEMQYFTLDALSSREDIKVFGAKLYVHLPADHGPVSQANNANRTLLENESNQIIYYGDEAWVYLYYAMVDKKTGLGSLIQTEATRVKLLANRGGWIDIDMMEILSFWLKYPNENLGLHISVRTKSNVELPVGVQHQTTNVSVFKFSSNAVRRFVVHYYFILKRR